MPRRVVMGKIDQMSTVEEIESAVVGRSPEELSRFREWFERLNANLWDEQWEHDAKSGKLDAVADRAIQDFRAGRCTEL